MNQKYIYTITSLGQVVLIMEIIAEWERFLEATPPEQLPASLAPENFTWDGSTLTLNHAWQTRFDESVYQWLKKICLLYSVNGIPDYPTFEEHIPHKYQMARAALRLTNSVKGTCVYDPPLPPF